MSDKNIMTNCQLRQYKEFLNKVQNFDSRPIMRKLKIEGILKKIDILVKHTK